MTPVKSFMTVNLGEGAKVQFPQAVLNTGYAGATIQFGTISEVMQFQQFLPENTASVPTVKGVAKKSATEVVNERSPKRTSVFSRLSIAPTTSLDEVPKEFIAEVPVESTQLSRKARRKANARLRASGCMPSTVQQSSPQLEANVPTNNGFEPLKWVKRNDNKGQLKKSFWETSRQQPQPPKKEESVSSKIYKILKAVKDRNLQRRLRKSVTEVISSNAARPQNRPQNSKVSTNTFREEFRRPPYHQQPRKFCPNMDRYPYFGRKRLGEPSDDPYTKGYNRRYDEGRPQQWYHASGHSKGHSDVSGHRYVATRRQQVWVPKRPKYPEAHNEDQDEKIYKGRLKSQVLKLSPEEKTSVDVTMPETKGYSTNNESPDSPVIHWKRRSQLENDLELDEIDDYYNDEDDHVKGYIDPMDVEVIRMVDHIPDRFTQRYTCRNPTFNLQNEEQLRDDQEQLRL